MNRNDDVESNSNYSKFEAFESNTNRAKFVRGVYSIMFIMLMITSIQAGIVYYCSSVSDFILDNYWLIFFGFLMYISATIMLCIKKVRKVYPFNLILLFLMVEGMSIIVSFSVIKYNIECILIAVMSTSAVCLLITLMALFCPIDITGCTLFFFALGILTIVASIGLIISHFIWPDKRIMIIYSYLIVVVTCAYLAYDTQLIMGGRSHQMEPDEYVLGACVLYIDIVIMFLYILNLQQ